MLKSLFRALSPIDASFLTQIILKDLRPILYPISEAHYTAALIDYNAASVKMLTKEHAMYTWDPTGWFINAYRVKSTLDEAARSYELPASQRKPNVPQLGVPVTVTDIPYIYIGCQLTALQIPKSEKGRDPRHALGYFHRSQRVWVETKYDGERAQIHVEVRPDNTVNITIFSKSKRDSTLDRMGIHDVIYRALGLSKNGIPCTNRSKIGKGIILDAEMVAFHDEKIDGTMTPLMHAAGKELTHPSHQNSGESMVWSNKQHTVFVARVATYLQNISRAQNRAHHSIIPLLVPNKPLKLFPIVNENRLFRQPPPRTRFLRYPCS